MSIVAKCLDNFFLLKKIKKEQVYGDILQQSMWVYNMD